MDEAEEEINDDARKQRELLISEEHLLYTIKFDYSKGISIDEQAEQGLELLHGKCMERIQAAKEEHALRVQAKK